MAPPRSYEATPHPKLVVAAGDCACSGGVFADGYAVCGALSTILPFDVTIPGCPPSQIALLRGILTALRSKREAIALTLNWWAIESQAKLPRGALLYLSGHTRAPGHAAMAWFSVSTQWASCALFVAILAGWALRAGRVD